MRKLSKLLAVVLCVAMLLSTTAFAASTNAADKVPLETAASALAKAGVSIDAANGDAGVKLMGAGFDQLAQSYEEYAAQPELYPDLYVIDNIPELYEDPANAGTYEGFKDIFLEDGLHFPPEVYETLWGPFFKREIEKILNL